MPKSQSFADKLKKHAKSELQNVICIVSYQDKRTGKWKFRERRVKVKEMSDLDSMSL